MAKNKVNIDKDFEKNSIINAKNNPLTTVDRIALGNTLTVDDEGLSCWDLDENMEYHWGGTQWLAVVGGGENLPEYLCVSEIIADVLNNDFETPDLGADGSYFNGNVSNWTTTAYAYPFKTNGDQWMRIDAPLHYAEQVLSQPFIDGANYSFSVVIPDYVPNQAGNVEVLVDGIVIATFQVTSGASGTGNQTFNFSQILNGTDGGEISIRLRNDLITQNDFGFTEISDITISGIEATYKLGLDRETYVNQADPLDTKTYTELIGLGATVCDMGAEGGGTETITTLVDNEDGTAIYTSEDATETKLNLEFDRDYYPEFQMVEYSIDDNPQIADVNTDGITAEGGATLVKSDVSWASFPLFRIDSTTGENINLKATPPTKYMKHVVMPYLGVTNSYFLKTVADGSRWCDYVLWVIDPNTNTPVLRIGAKGSTHYSSTSGMPTYMQPNQSPAKIYTHHEWLRWEVPADIIDTYKDDKDGTTKLHLAIIPASRSYVSTSIFIAGWGIAKNPYNLFANSGIFFHWGMDHPTKTQSTIAWNNNSWNGQFGLAQMNNGTEDDDIIMTFPTTTDDYIITVWGITQNRPIPMLRLMNPDGTVYKDLGYGSTKLSPYARKLEIGYFSHASWIIKKEDLTALAHGQSTMKPYVRMSFHNKYTNQASYFGGLVGEIINK